MGLGDASSDEDDEYDDKGATNNELVNVFTQYLVQQGYTNDFPDDFNDNEEDYDDDGETVFDADGQFDAVFNADDKKVLSSELFTCVLKCL